MKGRKPGGGKPHRGKALGGPPRGKTGSKLRPQRPERSDRPEPRRDRKDARREREPGEGGRDKARWVIGIHSCMETFRVRPKAIREVLLRTGYVSSQQLRELADLATKFKIPIREKSGDLLDRFGSGHQGVALAVTETPELDWQKLAEPGRKIVLVLDHIEDPHNLGSMLRTGWLAGASAVLIPEDRAVGLTATACKVASGGAEHIPVDAHVNLASAIQQLKDAGFWVYGLSERGERKPWDFSLPEKVAWVVGAEGSGLKVPTERACDELSRLPQVPGGSSFNASIAMAMALAETMRQFGSPE